MPDDCGPNLGRAEVARLDSTSGKLKPALYRGVDVVKSNKKLAARRQIIAAIDHLHKKDYECAITLAGAAEGQATERTATHLFRLILKRFSSDDANAFIRWMKHPSGPFNAEIEELEVVTTIIRAIQKYVDAYEETCPHFETFSEWCRASGYTKTSLTQKVT
jgi:hypothetical protein